ncbi:hypothetical protein [Pontiella sulfatireligans]|uniref:Uncharacterized protein n=1 Tax=Pontiella sulfatireligans TaxID=2750658 RepID=A0A6C2ULI6_9BACT|nr:hypothetical protein [Pontiella sulfatireligans]VGO21110.1 hypothetical protein SCARR_03180 [Pontiella sulfatireligans]
MKMRKQLALYALTVVGLLAAGQANAATEAFVDFTGSEGYTNGPLLDDVIWQGNYDPTNNTATVTTNGTGYSGNVGTVAMESPSDWHLAVNNKEVTMASAGAQMTVSTVFKFHSVAAAGANNRDMMGVRFYDDASGNTFVRVAYRRRTDGALQLFAGLNGTGKINPATSASSGSEADIGLTSLIDESDWLQLSATLTKGSTASDWGLEATLSNLTTGSNLLSHTFVGMTVGSELLDDNSFYGSFSTDYSDSKAGVTNRMIDRFEIQSNSIVPSETIVEWGGATNIVTAAAALEMGSKNSYVDFFESQPLSGYNLDNDVLSPKFNGNATVYWATRNVRDGGNGNDAIQFGNNSALYEHMVVWNEFLGTNTALSDLSMTMWETGNANTNDLRVVIQKGTGEWYASQELNLPGATTTTFALDVEADLQWYKFSPIHNGKAVLGSTLVTPQPDMEDVAAVGYYNKKTAGAGTYGETRCFFFQAKAKPAAVRSDIIFSRSFDNYNNGERFQSGGNNGVNGWDELNNEWGFGTARTNASGIYLVHRPATTAYTGNRGYNWRGVMFTNGLPQTVEVGDALEFSMSAKVFVRNALAGLAMYDFYFSTNGVSRMGAASPHVPSQQSFGTYPDGQLGFRVLQGSWINDGAWPDGGLLIAMDPAAPSASSGSVSLNDVGVTNLGAAGVDYETDELVYTYKALKTTNAGVWDVSFVLATTSGGILKTIDQSNWTNEALYNATDIYFGMYGPSALAAEEGLEINNMNCRMILGDEPVVPDTGWSLFLEAYPALSGNPGDDFDNDALTDWEEYVFGGIPTDGTNLGAQPMFDADSGDYMFYTINSEPTLVAKTLYRDNLVIGNWTTGMPVNVDGGTDDGTFFVNAVNFDTSSSTNQLFMKLEVVEP